MRVHSRLTFIRHDTFDIYSTIRQCLGCLSGLISAQKEGKKSTILIQAATQDVNQDRAPVCSPQLITHCRFVSE